MDTNFIIKMASRTKPWTIPIVILCTIFTSMASLFIKQGVDKFTDFSVYGLLQMYLILIGLVFYVLGFILLTIAFRHGELSTLFPFVSLSFVWVAILSYFILGEYMNIFEVVGVIIIVLGVVFIGMSDRYNKTKSAVRFRI